MYELVEEFEELVDKALNLSVEEFEKFKEQIIERLNEID